MNIGDKVRFLNDVGGGKITAIRPGGIVLVEDEDGFEMPILQSEVVVIEEDQPKVEQKKPVPKAEEKRVAPKVEQKKPVPKEEEKSLNGKEYLQSKTVRQEEDTEVDEQLEARLIRLEMTVQKLEARLARLEAENNLRKNEKLMTRQAQQQKKKPQPLTQLGDLQIL